MDKFWSTFLNGLKAISILPRKTNSTRKQKLLQDAGDAAAYLANHLAEVTSAAFPPLQSLAAGIKALVDITQVCLLVIVSMI